MHHIKKSAPSTQLFRKAQSDSWKKFSSDLLWLLSGFTPCSLVPLKSVNSKRSLVSYPIKPFITLKICAEPPVFILRSMEHRQVDWCLLYIALLTARPLPSMLDFWPSLYDPWPCRIVEFKMCPVVVCKKYLHTVQGQKHLHLRARYCRKKWGQ